MAEIIRILVFWLIIYIKFTHMPLWSPRHGHDILHIKLRYMYDERTNDMNIWNRLPDCWMYKCWNNIPEIFCRVNFKRNYSRVYNSPFISLHTGFSHTIQPILGHYKYNISYHQPHWMYIYLYRNRALVLEESLNMKWTKQ